MSRTLQEHDYISFSESSAMKNSNSNNGLTLKATELRLGLPGSESPERDTNNTHKNSAMLNGFVSGAKRGFCDALNVVFDGVPEVSSKANGSGDSAAKDCVDESFKHVNDKKHHHIAASDSKAQVVGWPPIRSFRKNSMASQSAKSDDNVKSKKGSGCLYVKVSMDGAPYLRKVDLENYESYAELSSGLEKMFSCFTIGQCTSHGVTVQDGLSEGDQIDLLYGSEYVLTYEDKDGDWMLVGDVPWRMFIDTCKRLRIMKSSDAIGLAPRSMEKFKGHN